MLPIPTANVSRVFFATDMTDAAAPEIPLGFLVEANWPDEARWLGLIGRTQLTAAELTQINLLTWPEMDKPFAMLDRLFDVGWEAAWGDAAAAAQELWRRSPLILCTSDASGLLIGSVIDTEAGWNATTRMLDAHLSVLGQQLVPYEPPQSVASRPQRPFPPPRGAFRVPPKGRRMQEGFALAA